MKLKFFLLPLMLFLVQFLPNQVFAQEQVSIDAALRVKKETLTVGDPIYMTLEVRHPANSYVIFPELAAEWGPFFVRSQSLPETIDNADGGKTTTQIIDARLFAPGEYETPATKVTVADSDGMLTEVEIDPLMVGISSVLVEGDSELRDIKPQADLPYFAVLPLIIASGALILAATIVIWLLRRQRQASALIAEERRLPHEIALARLDQIEELGLPSKGRFKEHYTLLSDCLRIYIEQSYSLPVMERTTDELRSTIKQAPLTASVAHQFISLLEESDLVKFSEFAPDVHRASHSIHIGKQIVEQTTPPTKGDESLPGESDSSGGQMVKKSDASPSANGRRPMAEVRK